MNEAISTYDGQDRPPFDPLELLTVREAAALLHVSRPTVEKYIKRGELRSILIGRCRRIPRVDLEAFLECRTGHGWQPYEPEPDPSVDEPTEGPWGGEEGILF